MAPADDAHIDRSGEDSDAPQADPGAGRTIDEPPLTRFGETPSADSGDDDYEPL